MENQSSKQKRVVIVVIVVIILVVLLALCTSRPKYRLAPVGTQLLSPATTATGAQPSGSQAPGTGGETPTATPLLGKVTPSGVPVSPLATIVVQLVDARSGPGLLFPIITTLPAATVVPVLGRNEASSWLFILLPDGRQGWVPLVAAQLKVLVESLPIVQSPPEPTSSPYGQGMLGHPDLPGLAPTAQMTATRKTLAAVSLIILALTAAGARLMVAWQRPEFRKSSLSRLLQMLTSLF